LQNRGVMVVAGVCYRNLPQTLKSFPGF